MTMVPHPFQTSAVSWGKCVSCGKESTHRLHSFDTERERKAILRLTALSKLTQEEKEALGVTQIHV